LPVLDEGWDRIDIVAHSFGTYLVALALRSICAQRSFSVRSVILGGSVLPARFRWSRLVPTHVRRVVNDCGTHDNVLWLSQAIPLLGMAGRTGFVGMTGSQLRNRFFSIGHSGYFQSEGSPSDAFMSQYWVPLLCSEEDPPLIDQRISSWLTPVEMFLQHNAKPTKLIVYAAAVAAVVGVGWPIASRAYAVNQIERVGYVTNDKGRVTVSFNAARPGTAMRAVNSIGAIHELDISETEIGDADIGVLRPNETLDTINANNSNLTAGGLALLERFPKLRDLNLGNLPLKTLNGLPRFTQLESLNLTRTGLRDEDLVHVGPLTSLKTLILSANPIRGTGLENLRSLSRLEEIFLDQDTITDVGLMHLPALPRLRALNLQYNAGIKGAGLAAVGWVVSLEELWAIDTNVDGESLANLVKLERLKIISMPGTKVGGGGFAALAGLPALKELYLGSTKITDNDLADIAKMAALETLFIPGNRVSDAGIEHILSMRALRKLNIDGTDITETGLARLHSARPDITLAHLGR